MINELDTLMTTKLEATGLHRELQALIDHLPDWLLWGPHNLLGHTVKYLLDTIGLVKLGEFVHDMTLPASFVTEITTV